MKFLKELFELPPRFETLCSCWRKGWIGFRLIWSQYSVDITYERWSCWIISFISKLHLIQIMHLTSSDYCLKTKSFLNKIPRSSRFVEQVSVILWKINGCSFPFTIGRSSTVCHWCNSCNWVPVKLPSMCVYCDIYCVDFSQLFFHSTYFIAYVTYLWSSIRLMGKTIETLIMAAR